MSNFHTRFDGTLKRVILRAFAGAKIWKPNRAAKCFKNKSNMNNDTNQQLLKALHWRYATKIFDPAKKISADSWQTLEQVLVLTPSSYGLQPYRFLVINNPARRAELLPHSWNQPQVVDASHFVVFVARKVIKEADVDKFTRRISQVR